MLSALPGLGARCFNGRMRAGARRRVRVSRYLISMLEISTSRASSTAFFMSSGNSMEERLGFFLVKVEVRDEDVGASWFNVGKKDG